ncbi:MAG TPA: L,D-transpeptidase [Pyrinomonadaceae bacterium]|jgi:lipoprotein-anchoring transpeptidase ErfK/SrfK
MKKLNFYHSKTVIYSIVLLIFAAFLGGCEAPTVTNTAPATNTNTAPATNANIAQAPPTNNRNVAALPVTLPVLDAMFFDEGFNEELKTKLQLTDEQIEKLKNVSREAVGNLEEAEDYDGGSTRAATTRAEEQIRSIIGDDKTNQLFELVRNRWSSGTTEMASAGKPNAIPTDSRIVVNAPAYRMDVFQDGNLTKSYKVGIGYPEFPLPTGMRKADTIIFNPTWTPPDEPWVKGKVKPGQKVEAGSKLNPLGPIKIPIGLPSLIHGGKSPARLGSFASHGCVGLTDQQVQDFSVVLAQLSGSQLTPEDVKNYEKQKTETKNFKLNASIPIELRYETIVVEDGKLKIYRDVYERGTNTLENLRRVLDSYGVAFDSLSQPDQQKIIQALNEMNRDAQGNLIVENVETAPAGSPDAASNSNTNTNSTNKSQGNSNSNKGNSNSDDGKVTRTIKGKKEVAVNLAQLQGKGYPAPVALNSGGSK